MYADVPEWSNGADSKSAGLVPTKVRILSSAFTSPGSSAWIERKVPNL